MATPYEVLCENYQVSRDAYFNDELACWDLANTLWKDLAKYLGLPPEQDGMPSGKLNLLPPDDEASTKDGSRLLSPGAVKLGKDSFWHFKLGLLIEEAPNTFPKIQIVLGITMKPYEKFVVIRANGFGKSFVKFSRTGKFVNKNPDASAKMMKICNRIVEKINQSIKSKPFFEHGKEEFDIHDDL
jgi:hypothetical protein